MTSHHDSVLKYVSPVTHTGEGIVVSDVRSDVAIGTLPLASLVERVICSSTISSVTNIDPGVAENLSDFLPVGLVLGAQRIDRDGWRGDVLADEFGMKFKRNLGVQSQASLETTHV